MLFDKSKLPRQRFTQEELHTFIVYKKLKEKERIQLFKKTLFYKLFNTLNMLFCIVFFYLLFSFFSVLKWQAAVVETCEGVYSFSSNGKTIVNRADVFLTTHQKITIFINEAVELPRKGANIWLGKDYLFGKTLSVKFSSSNSSFFVNTAFAYLFIVSLVLFCTSVLYYYNFNYKLYSLIAITIINALALMYVILF